LVALDYQQALYHVGVRVPDLDAAMAELTAALGITWADVVEQDRPVWTPAEGSYTIPLRFTYSREGPQHIELLQGEPGSLWDGNDRPGVHHMGGWVDDVAAETERLVEAGWTLKWRGGLPKRATGR
jgi:lactoylglutathione lyase